MNSIMRLLRLNANKLTYSASSAIASKLSYPQQIVAFMPASNICMLHRNLLSGQNQPSNLLWKAAAINFYVPNRTKFNKEKGSGREEDSEDEEDDLSEYNVDGKRDRNVVQFKATSMRLDLIIKSALGISRNKIEEHFYGSRIRVNGKKIQKKSIRVHTEDVIDVVKSFCPLNPDNIIVSRIEILSMVPRDETIVITVRRNKSHTIENYPAENAFKSSAE